MRKVAGVAVALTLAAGAFLAPTEASPHGRHYHDKPPVIVAPPGHRPTHYPYWYYSRPQPRRHAPPAIVLPSPRSYHYDRPRLHRPHHHRPPHHRFHQRHQRPGVTFDFRF